MTVQVHAARFRSADMLVEILHGKRTGLLAALVRSGLACVAPLYVAGLKLFLAPYRLGIRKQTRLGVPVISIGNLTTGGTGKTPLTQYLCRVLSSAGSRPAVLSRGYMGSAEHGAVIVSDRNAVLLSADEAGDEPLLLARSLPGIPVLVGRDRRTTGAIAIETFHPDVLVLDDGMQFYQLYRDLDIVALDAEEPFDNGWTFPRGLLREPPSHLSRAQVLVIMHSAALADADLRQLESRLLILAPKAVVLKADYRATGYTCIGTGAICSLEQMRGTVGASYCGIAKPQRFEDQLEREQIRIVKRIRYADHMQASEVELEHIASECAAEGATALFTTAKDAVKLTTAPRALPLYILNVELVVNRPEELLAAVDKSMKCAS